MAETPGARGLARRTRQQRPGRSVQGLPRKHGPRGGLRRPSPGQLSGEPRRASFRGTGRPRRDVPLGAAGQSQRAPLTHRGEDKRYWKTTAQPAAKAARGRTRARTRRAAPEAPSPLPVRFQLPGRGRKWLPCTQLHRAVKQDGGARSAGVGQSSSYL